MRQIRLLSVLTGLTLLSCIACRRADDSRTIYAIPRNPTFSLSIHQHAGMAQAASRMGVNVYWNGPRGGDDTQQQIDLMERAIHQRSEGIVISPTAAFALDTVIQRALSNRIPVVILGASIPFPKDPQLTFVLNDINIATRMAAQRMCKDLSSIGEIGVIGMDPVVPGDTALVAAF